MALTVKVADIETVKAWRAAWIRPPSPWAAARAPAWLTTVARSGQTEAEFIARLMPAARQAAADYDHLAGSYAAPAVPDPAQVRDAKFAYGLEVVLDGLALRLPR